MSKQTQFADLEWRDGKIPIATQFDDPYFSLDNGMAETEYVFLGGNDLPDRFETGFHIAELGFGSGLNLLCAWKAWDDAGFRSPLSFTSFEAFPMALKDMATAQAAWPELAPYSQKFLELWNPTTCSVVSNTLNAKVILGDARDTVSRWRGKADAWFLDGFSPAKNPELWGEALMKDLAQHTRKGGTFATYTAAGHVRHSLSEAGFKVERIKGFGRKRHMTRGILP